MQYYISGGVDIHPARPGRRGDEQIARLGRGALLWPTPGVVSDEAGVLDVFPM